MSNYLNNEVKVGDTYGVLPPNGHFKLSLKPEKKNIYYFFGAGSGITPLMSMIASILENEPNTHCHLLYASRNEGNIIYKRKLDRLQLVYKDRFDLSYILSRPKKEKSDGSFNILTSPKITWTGNVGRIDKENIERFLKNKNSKNIDGYYICGPGQMIEATYDSLVDLKIEKELIHREYFSAPVSDDAELASSIAEGEQIDATVKVILDGKEIDLQINDNTNVVQALLDKNIEPPYSCLSGTCSTCMAKLEEGEVAMDVSIGLEDDEKENGFILTCQAHPLTAEVKINFDKV